MRLGVIADTHGRLRPEALAALAGADLILHAGDVGRNDILERLADIAPVTAIRGNIDIEAPASDLPETVTLALGGLRLHMLHDLKALDRDPAAEGWDVVISGHSHRALVCREGGVLFLNPGSAGPRRFRLPVTLAWLTLAPAGPEAQIVTLDAD